jgi:hypothetical protein
MHTGVGVRTEIPVGHVMGRGNLLHIFGKLIDEIVLLQTELEFSP